VIVCFVVITVHQSCAWRVFLQLIAMMMIHTSFAVDYNCSTDFTGNSYCLFFPGKNIKSNWTNSQAWCNRINYDASLVTPIYSDQQSIYEYFLSLNGIETSETWIGGRTVKVVQHFNVNYNWFWWSFDDSKLLR